MLLKTDRIRQYISFCIEVKNRPSKHIILTVGEQNRHRQHKRIRVAAQKTVRLPEYTAAYRRITRCLQNKGLSEQSPFRKNLI